MNIKLKFSIILIATLLIGIAIGFEISEISIKSHFREMDEFRESRGFVGLFENIIRPDTEQKVVVYSVLLKYHKMIDSTAKAGMTMVSKMMDSMFVELKKNLKDDQIKRLENEMERMKNGLPPPPNGDPNMGPGRRPGPDPNRDPNRNPNMDYRQGPPPFEKDGKFLKPQGINRPPQMPKK
jgi:hypothetical protein